MIRNKIWDSEQFSSLTISERLLYIALVTKADDEGCFTTRPKYWKKVVFYEDRGIGPKKIQQMLERMEEIGLIHMGNTKSGEAGFHPNWHRHQSLRSDRSKPSEYSELLVAHGLPTLRQKLAEEKLSQDKSKQDNQEKRGSKSAAEQMLNGFVQQRSRLINEKDMNK